MKRAALFIGLVTLFVFSLGSCKKNSGDDEDCEITVAAIAGTYKLISSKYVNGATETDAIHDLYDDCELDDTNDLKADKTFMYNDAGTVCSPGGSTSGTWDISGMTLILNSGFSVIESFDCRDLVVTFDFGGQTIRETYRKL